MRTDQSRNLLAPTPSLRDLNLKHLCRKTLRPGKGKELRQGNRLSESGPEPSPGPQLPAPWPRPSHLPPGQPPRLPPSHPPAALLATPLGCCLFVGQAHGVDVFGEADGLLELQQGDVPVQVLPPVVPGVDVDLFQHGDLFNLSLIAVQTPAEKRRSCRPPNEGQLVPRGRKLPALRVWESA